MHKAPYRATNDVSQQFNDGVVDIFTVADTAQPGYQPVEKLTHKYHLFYEEQRLGINRLYLSRQNMIEISKVIRVPRHGSITNQDVAILEDGTQYRIDSVQSVTGSFPPSLDLALQLIKQIPNKGAASK